MVFEILPIRNLVAAVAGVRVSRLAKPNPSDHTIWSPMATATAAPGIPASSMYEANIRRASSIDRLIAPRVPADFVATPPDWPWPGPAAAIAKQPANAIGPRGGMVTLGRRVG